MTTRIDIFLNDDQFLSFAAGDVIFREGDAGDTMYAVIDGSVDIVVGDRIVDTTEVGGLVGEMAVIDSQPRSATAITASPCKLVPINQRRFLFLVQQTPFFAVQVMQIMAERHRRLLAEARGRSAS